MSLTLIAVVVALVLGHAAPALAAGVRDFSWYRHWLHWLGTHFPSGFWRGRYGIVLALVPPLLLVALFQAGLHKPMLGLAGLVFAIAMLFYCWGPRDLDLDVEAIVSAPDPQARIDAIDRLRTPGVTAPQDATMLVEAVFRNAQRRWFGVLFWFLVLGPVGALLYRLGTLASEDDIAELPPDTSTGARALLSVLDWPVAQLMTLALALVGNFDTVVGAWREHGGASVRRDTDFLAAAARASVSTELADEALDDVDSGTAMATTAGGMTQLAELRDAMSLVWRVLLSWLVVLALFVVAGWVG